jgi:hypothetical protein
MVIADRSVGQEGRVTVELPTTRREAIWQTCPAKRCCYTALVIPTGRDVWRIARALDAPPWSFLVYFRSVEPRADAFRLAPDGLWLRLALAKQRPTRRRDGPLACCFLLRTRQRDHRCGLAELRPGVCRTFPLDRLAGLIGLRDEPGCSCRRWSLADFDPAKEERLIAAGEAELAEYGAVVAEWNRLVEAGRTGPTDFFAYLTFLLTAYDRIAEATP